MTALLYNNSMTRRLAFVLIAFFGFVMISRMISSGQIWAPESEQNRWSGPKIITQIAQEEYRVLEPELVETEPKTTTPRSRITPEMQEHLTWEPPIEIRDHYPPYDQYANRDYDPNRWEAFEQ
jgi:hypothetical protein